MKFLNFEKDDYSLIRELDNDPDVMRFITNGIPSNEKEVKRALNIFLTYNKSYNHKFGYWKALCKDTDKFLGWFHFRPLKSNLDDIENIELGYRLMKDSWGQGYATEGSRALIDKAKKELVVKKVWAQTMLQNTSSINVMKKIGLTFEYEDTYEQWPGEDKRCVWYSLKI